MAKAKTVSVDVTPPAEPKKAKLDIPEEIQELYEELLKTEPVGEYYSGEWCMDTLKKEIRKA